MLLDHTGQPMDGGLSKEEVMEKLSQLAPKNEEEYKILVKKVAEIVEYNRRQRLGIGLDSGFGDTFAKNRIEQNENDGYTENKGYRKIADIPRDMAFVAEEVWGPEVWTDKNIFKKAFVEDETGRMCLTVDHKSI